MIEELKKFIDKQNLVREKLTNDLKGCDRSQIGKIKEEFYESTGKTLGAIFALNLALEELKDER